MERDALFQLAGQLQRLVAAGQLTDLEALARLAERRAETTGLGWRERWRFVADLVTVTTELDLTGILPRRHDRWVRFGESGFAARYLSSDPLSTNQVRHLSAYLPLGFLLTGWLAAPLPWLLEVAAALVRRQRIDRPDIALGQRGVALGHALLSHRLTPREAGHWLRGTLGSTPGGTTTDASYPGQTGRSDGPDRSQ